MSKTTDNVGKISEPPSAPSTKALELCRERERQPVNEFLEQRHPLGSVPGWKACFSARYQDSIVALVVVGRPTARMADDGTELSITRYCRRDDRPDVEFESVEDVPEFVADTIAGADENE